MGKYAKKMLVVGGSMSYYTPFAKFYDVCTDVNYYIENPNSIDIVLFTGGADVTAMLYEDDSPRLSRSDWDRDEEESRLVDFAVKNGTMMVGICRGLQLLNAMDGGRLLHHIDDHEGSTHAMFTHRNVIKVNSLHHQACVPSAHSYVIGWSEQKEAPTAFGDKDEILPHWPNYVVEAMILPRLNAYGVQYHPEMMDPSQAGYEWFQELVKDFHDNTMTMDKILEEWTYKLMTASARRIAVGKDGTLVAGKG